MQRSWKAFAGEDPPTRVEGARPKTGTDPRVKSEKRRTAKPSSSSGSVAAIPRVYDAFDTDDTRLDPAALLGSPKTTRGGTALMPTAHAMLANAKKGVETIPPPSWGARLDTPQHVMLPWQSTVPQLVFSAPPAEPASRASQGSPIAMTMSAQPTTAWRRTPAPAAPTLAAPAKIVVTPKPVKRSRARVTVGQIALLAFAFVCTAVSTALLWLYVL